MLRGWGRSSGGPVLARYNLPYPRLNTWYIGDSKRSWSSRSALAAGQLETNLGSKEQPETLKSKTSTTLRCSSSLTYRVHDLYRVFLVFCHGSIGFGSTLMK